jgi:hypothetical protein
LRLRLKKQSEIPDAISSKLHRFGDNHRMVCMSSFGENWNPTEFASTSAFAYLAAQKSVGQFQKYAMGLNGTERESGTR